MCFGGGKKESASVVPAAKNQDRDSLPTDRVSVDNDGRPETLKFLLLGAGCSGKSTVHRQLLNLYGKGFTDDQRMGFRKHVHRNVVQIAQVLADESEWHDETELEDKDLIKFIEGLNLASEVTVEVAEKIHALWTNEKIQLLIRNISNYEQDVNIPDSTAYFMDKVLDVAGPDYVPSNKDIFHLRIRTTGINETTFNMGKKIITVVDVGGQRSERKKWVHQFKNVSGIIFVASLAAYDQLLFEDETTNRMKEAVFVFKKIIGTPLFNKVPVSLFFNKLDIFTKKVQTNPISKFFPAYDGDEQDVDASCKFISNTFLTHAKSKDSNLLNAHFLTAVDSDKVDEAFRALLDAKMYAVVE